MAGARARRHVASVILNTSAVLLIRLSSFVSWKNHVFPWVPGLSRLKYTAVPGEQLTPSLPPSSSPLVTHTLTHTYP